MQAQGIQGKLKDYEKEVSAIDEMILALMKPECYAEKEGSFIINFDKNCLSLTLHFNLQEPGKMPVRQFLGALKDLKEYLKPKRKNGTAVQNK